MKRILLTGASGIIGSRVHAALTGVEQIQVIPTYRGLEPPPIFRGEGILLDLRRPIALEDQFDVVIHVAGVKRGLVQTNIDGTARLALWAAEHGVRHFVLLSSVGVYGARGRALDVNENSPQLPGNDYERSKASSEVVARDICGASGMALSILRPSTVLAPDPPRRCPLLAFLRAVQAGRLGMFKRWDSVVNYVHVDDVAAAIAEVGCSDDMPRTLILNAPITVSSLVAIAERELGLRPSRLAVPPWLIGTARRAANLARTLGVESAASAQELSSQTLFSSAAAAQELQTRLRPMNEVISELIQLYRSHGLID